MVRSTARKGASALAWSPPEAVVAASQAASAHLVESLLHDARNPLNAMAINLELLSEKLKDDSGAVPPALEKNIRAMRDQVFRVDGILRAFAEFLATQPNQVAELSLSQVLERAQEVLGHEARKRRVKVRVDLEPGLQVRMADQLALRFLAYQSLLRALLRSSPGGEVGVSLRRAGDRAVLRVLDEAGDGEPNALARRALEELGRAREVEVSIQAGCCEMTFPGPSRAAGH